MGPYGATGPPPSSELGCPVDLPCPFVLSGQAKGSGEKQVWRGVAEDRRRDPRASPGSAWVGVRIKPGAWGWGLQGMAKCRFVPPPLHPMLGVWPDRENT